MRLRKNTWIKKRIGWITMMATGISFLQACQHKVVRNAEMIDLLSSIEKSEYSAQNPFSDEARLEFFQSANKNRSAALSDTTEFMIGNSLLEGGKEQLAISAFEKMMKTPWQSAERRAMAMKQLAMANLRLGERTNCLHNHMGGSCIFPITGTGVHADKTGSEKAIEIYEQLLSENPVDFESRWLLNIAYMTIGGYPKNVPPLFLIKGLDTDTGYKIKPFVDVAANLGLNTNNLAGGSIVDDFDNDGYLDIVTSSWSLREGMRYCRNNANGTFTEISDSSGLGFITGGLNIMQTDYNNDGLKDIFITRGGWRGTFGREPNSLLKNNGDGTFTDVTKESGLLSFHPTQTATWNDFNNDGWLDVFIGNETTRDDINPCELFINNKNGTFTEIAEKAGCKITAYVKGVTSGDFDNDGLPDIFISTLDTAKILLKNEGIQNGSLHFKDVTQQSGLGSFNTRTFPTWFWDYDNDGWLDLMVAGYEYNKSLSWYAAAEAMGIPSDNSGKVFLFRNNHNGSFENVSDKVGLSKNAFAMGSNFGDIDNDGYLDIYMGTGNPLFQSLIPNKMFKNIDGIRFVDVTTSSRLGNLQKGHAVSFADIDNDGDEDIYAEMGGAYSGDNYFNSLYMNPGQNSNNSINIKLEGSTSNRVAIGARIKVTFKDNGLLRSVYREVNSGGSFGANPLTQHIGIGQATEVESVEIKWPASNTVQVFKDIHAGDYVKIKEGNSAIAKVKLVKADLTAHRLGIISCAPSPK